MADKPTLTGVSATFDEMLAWLQERIAQAEGKLPPGVKLADEDLKELALAGIGRFGPAFWEALIADGVAAVMRGYGPNQDDPSFLA